MKSIRRIVIAVAICAALLYLLSYVDVVRLLEIDTSPKVREMRPDEKLDPVK